MMRMRVILNQKKTKCHCGKMIVGKGGAIFNRTALSCSFFFYYN